MTRIARYDVSDTLLQQSERTFDRRGRHYRTTDMRYDASGMLRKVWLFVMALGHSRHMFLDLVFDQKTDTWIPVLRLRDAA